MLISIVRHLRALTFDFRLTNNWSDPNVIALIEYFLNSAIHSERNLSPIDSKFGTYDSKYFTLPTYLPCNKTSSILLQKLNHNLKTIRHYSYLHQQKSILQRTKNNLP